MSVMVEILNVPTSLRLTFEFYSKYNKLITVLTLLQIAK